MDCADEFLELALKERKQLSYDHQLNITARDCFAVPPVVVNDCYSLTENERSKIVDCYNTSGVCHFIICNPPEVVTDKHPLFLICAQLANDLNLHYPLTHPLEGHSEAVKRFGPPDGTFKIYDLPKPINGLCYREVAESSDPFEVHLDGLGSGGTVQSLILYMDDAPLFGGFTFFYDMFALGMALADQDMEAFRHLFLPDAFTAIRPRGKGAIKVVTPVFYLNEAGLPHVFFRQNSGEYRMLWRGNCPPLNRASQFLERFTQPFSPGSFFVPFSRRGCACICRNRDIAHGRTSFIDGNKRDQCRLLSRKWFMTNKEHSEYKHVPGVLVRKDLAVLAPNQFGDLRLKGEWLYDEASDTNIRIR
jgi:hypothetical protein